MESFKALIARENDGKSAGRVESLVLEDLPSNNVTVRVHFSNINYKDALAVTGRGKICRQFPMVCGIDLAGEIIDSDDPQWPSGTSVLINGFGLSEEHWGGYSQIQRVKSEWLVKIPERFNYQEVMAIGTAGYTAMLSVQALQDAGLQPADGKILVSGATGGVGSVATMLLSKLGYAVTGVSGKRDADGYLKSLGASETIARTEMDRRPRPLESEAWAGAIDSVGSATLASILAQVKYDGVVAACGLAGGVDIPTTVMPFILRGVTLRGIDSVMAPQTRRQRAWQALSELLEIDKLLDVCQTVTMDEIADVAEDMLLGRIKGRIVVDVKNS